MQDISEFRGSNYYLSNFYEVPFVYNGIRYRSVENAFQAAKVFDRDVQLKMSQVSPSDAKHMGRRVSLRPDWEDVKVGIMKDIVRCKFEQHPDLADKLVSTGNCELTEGNTWNDRYWGVDLRTGRGANHLGQILMELREEFAIERGVSLKSKDGADLDFN